MKKHSKISGLILASGAVLLLNLPAAVSAEQNMSKNHMGKQESKIMMTTMEKGSKSDMAVKDSVMMMKDTVNVPGMYLKNAQAPGPFTAGVNQVIPYDMFGGDGMLTRLLLKSSKGAPWSDNGMAKNKALLPFMDLEKDMYFYQVKLDGDLGNLQDKALLDKLQMNGKMTYKAMVEVYGKKDGMADMNNKIASKKVTIKLNHPTTDKEVKEGLMTKLLDKVEVPAKYLKKADFPGPFTAGVNQVIPLENFGGDGMLTRLLLKSSKGAPWSDNGKAKNKALLPVKDLEDGRYFYQVRLDGKLGKLEDKALLKKLKMSKMKTYKAMVKVYGSKNGKADMSHMVGEKMVSFMIK
ncbi:SSURE domain-containing protein [Streptococcus catagoni]|uniref:SSURE domain-containing protein n=1 Tax=Streptococcus catagoni TaxID=2654874 RepID=UPI00140E180F|nr:fibronectin-binding SSURE repeat-containing protein [Streptococcus catagoni]